MIKQIIKGWLPGALLASQPGKPESPMSHPHYNQKYMDATRNNGCLKTALFGSEGVTADVQRVLILLQAAV